jgi:hypothetical protein
VLPLLNIALGDFRRELGVKQRRFCLICQ